MPSYYDGLWDDVLALVVRHINSEKQTWNYEPDRLVEVDSNGEIYLSNDIVAVHPHDYKDFPEEKVIIRANQRLYDLKNRSFTFRRSFRAGLVRLLTYNELPESVKKWAYIKAARIFTKITNSEDSEKIFTQEDEDRAKAVALETFSGHEFYNAQEIVNKPVNVAKSTDIPSTYTSGRYTFADGTTLLGKEYLPVLRTDRPLVILMAGSGGSYLEKLALASTLRDLGFFAIALDNPGQGPSVNENLGTTWGNRFGDELSVGYIHEVIKQVKTQYSWINNVLCFEGTSNGATIANGCAAQAGRTFSSAVQSTLEIGASETFPAVKAIVQNTFCMNVLDQRFPQDREALSLRVQAGLIAPDGITEWDENGGASQGSKVNAVIKGDFSGYCVEDDVSGLLAEVSGYSTFNNQWVNNLNSILASDTHFLINTSQDDGWRGTQEQLEVMRNYTGNGKIIFTLPSAGGHRSAETVYGTNLKTRRIESFLDYHAFGNTDGIGTYFEQSIYDDIHPIWVGTKPVTQAEEQDDTSTSGWVEARISITPQQDNWGRTRYFFQADNTLSLTEETDATASSLLTLGNPLNVDTSTLLNVVNQGGNAESQYRAAFNFTELEFSAVIPTDGKYWLGPTWCNLVFEASTSEFALGIDVFYRDDTKSSGDPDYERFICSTGKTYENYTPYTEIEEVVEIPIVGFGEMTVGKHLIVKVKPFITWAADYPDGRGAEFPTTPPVTDTLISFKHNASKTSYIDFPLYANNGVPIGAGPVPA